MAPSKTAAKAKTKTKGAATKAKTPAARKLKRQHDPDTLRIVPLHVASDAERLTPEALAAGPATAPHLTYRGGPLLTSVKVFTIFWGAAWQGAQAALVTKVNAFFDYVLTSPLIDQLSEYSVPGQTIGHGSRTGSTTVRTPQPARSVTDAALQTFLKNEIANNKTLPKPDANTLYFVYVPPGVRVVQGGSASCKAFCGYHNAAYAHLHDHSRIARPHATRLSRQIALSSR